MDDTICLIPARSYLWPAIVLCDDTMWPEIFLNRAKALNGPAVGLEAFWLPV